MSRRKTKKNSSKADKRNLKTDEAGPMDLADLAQKEKYLDGLGNISSMRQGVGEPTSVGRNKGCWLKLREGSA